MLSLFSFTLSSLNWQKFRKYVTYGQDIHQYLYYTLEGLVKEQLAYGAQVRARVCCFPLFCDSLMRCARV